MSTVSPSPTLPSDGELFRLLLENVHDHAIFILDPSGRVQTWNAGAEGLLGYTDDEITGQPLALFFTPEDRRAGIPERELQQARATGRASDDRWLIRKGGVRFWCSGALSALKDEGGDVRGFAKIMRDRTDFKMAAEGLRQAERQSRTVLESIGDAFLAVDAQWKFTYANGQAERIYGIRREDVLGRSFWEAFPGIVGGPFEAPYRRAMERQEPMRAEGFYEPLGRWFEVDALPIEGGGLSFYLRDVTERRRIEAALREGEERYRRLVNAVPGVVWSSRPDGSTDFQSDRWYEYTGLSRQGEIAQDWRCVIHPEDLPGAVELWAHSVRTGEPYRAEYRVRRARDGEYRWWLAEGVPIRDDRGAIVRWFGTCTDIHELRLAQQELREADRRKDEFLATLAHELRNPLAPIRSAVQVVKAKGFTDPDLVWSRDVIDRQVGQMARLLDDLLDISRISRNTLELRRERVPLATVLEKAVETSRPLIEQMGHALAVEMPDEPIALDADEARLAQVFSNLLNNAAKYSDRGGRIWLAAERRGPEAAVIVRDEGIGIDPADLPHVFELFSQATPALDRALGGLGIGLSLVRGLVELHGGTVEARSEGHGRGSEFVVRLPASDPAGSDAAGEVEDPADWRSSLKILIVDDNRDGANSLAMMLRILGNETRSAYDGEEAVSAAGEFRPDVVLLDIGLPGINGYEACRRMRAQPWGRGMVIIAQTGWGQEEDRRKTQDNGFDYHLIKPVDTSALMKLLAEPSRIGADPRPDTEAAASGSGPKPPAAVGGTMPIRPVPTRICRGPIMIRLPLSGFRAYLAAIAGVVVATTARSLLNPVLGNYYVFATYFITLLLTLWACGPGPSVMALVLGTLAGVFLFLPPFAQAGVPDLPHVVGMLLYLFVGAMSILVTEAQRRARRRDEEATGLLNALLGSAPIGMGYLDRDCRYISINEALARLHGRPVADHLGRAASEVAPWAWRDLGPIYRRVLGTGEPDLGREITLESGPGAGGPHTLQTHTFPVRIEGRGIVGIGIAVVDLTERLRLERDLKASEERLRRIYDQAEVGIVTCRPDGALTFANPGFCRMIGREPGEIASIGLADVIPSGGTGPAAPGIARGFDRDTYEAELRRKDGTTLWASITATALRDDDGTQQGGLAIVQDISQRRAAEESLRIQNAKIGRLVDSNIIGVLFADGDRITGANDAFLATIGRARADLEAGRLDWHDLTPAEHRPSAEKARSELLDRGACTPFQMELRLPDGGRVPILIGGALIDHAVPTWVCFVQDMTRIKQVERELRDADRRKDEFLAMLAHELRNPLAPIRNGIEVLEMAEGDEESRQWACEVIDRQVRHLTSLVDDLLDVSRITQGKITLHRSPLDVSAFVHAAVESSRPLISARGHHLQVDIGEGPLRVDGDATRLAQVVTNLLNNAAKYTPAGGHIRLSARRDGGRVAILVVDDGEGITPEMLPRVFELFAQADRSIDRSGGGLGIGLTLVKRLVEMHGGTVEARSEGPGRGSEFRVKLPLVATRPGAEADRPGPAPPAEGDRPRRILLVDDNVDSAETLACLLGRLGHQVTLAHDGPSAIEAASASAPDLALLDIGLPGMDGYEVARRFRGDRARAGMQLVALTGYGSEADRRLSREAGFDDHLVKPVEFEALRRILARERGGDDPGAPPP
ncbi:MAG: PAS domain S-box protein [Isosphaeraceae bacterium]